MKKILALFLVLATVLSLMTVGAYAAADNALSVSCKLYDGYTVVTVQKSGTVYYTTDGSNPKTSDTAAAYSAAFTAPAAGSVVKAYAAKAGLLDSAILTLNI